MCIVCALRNPTNLNALLDQHLDRGSVTPSAANPNDPVWTAFDAVRETGDLAESTATTASLIVGQSAYGTLSSSTDEDWFAIELVAGVTYDFRLLGFGSAFLDDPLIRIYNSAGVQQASNDDGFTSLSGTHERDSELVFTATTTGTYYIAADAFSTETGDYVISATPHDPNGRIFTADEIAWQLINNGEAFFSSPEGIGFDVGVGGTLTVNITGLTADGQFLARQALAVWSGFTGITFSETGGAADITFDDNQSGAFANPVPNVAETFIESATVNIGTDWLTQFGTGLESYSFETYIHEIGHAIGLGHGGNYNGSATYTFDNFYQNDSVAWSIMSYMNADNDEFDFGNPTDWNFYVDAAFRYMYSPMIADMIAIEYLYGINTGAFGGNTTWGVNGNTGVLALDSAVNSGALMAMMVYDRGGIDTVNMATGTVAQVISLVDGSLSSVLGGRNNLGIARDSVVENAIGGSAQDTIYGNEVGNRLEGRNGNDTLYGGSGQDTLIGGVGADRLDGGVSIDTASYRGATASIRAELINAAVNVGEAAGDVYVSIEGLEGSNFNDTLGGNNGVNRLLGLDGNDVIYGRQGNDTIDGGVGNDTMVGGVGADSLIGGSGTDTASYRDGTVAVTADLQTPGSNTSIAVGDTYSSIENLFGTDFNDRLFGNGSANLLSGFAGNDSLSGRSGNDTLNGGDGADTMVGGAGNDRLLGGAGTDFFLFDTAISGTNRDTITDFVAVDDTIRLDDAIFAALSLGTLAGSAFRAGTAATTAAHRIIYDSATGRMYYDSDGVGGAAQQLFGYVTAGTVVNANDFVVV